jgi:hypothetical protein
MSDDDIINGQMWQHRLKWAACFSLRRESGAPASIRWLSYHLCNYVYAEYIIYIYIKMGESVG